MARGCWIWRASWSIRSAMAGTAIPLIVWLTFEMSRFGRLFGGYEGEAFSHPWLDGFWRLLIGPNFGLLLFFPAAIAIPLVWRRAQRAHEIRLIAATVSAALVLLGLLAIASSISSGSTGISAIRFTGPLAVTRMSSSIRTPNPSSGM